MLLLSPPPSFARLLGSNDRAALFAFVRTGWDTRSDGIGAWDGVTVKDGRVVKLDFGAKGEGKDAVPGKALQGVQSWVYMKLCLTGKFNQSPPTENGWFIAMLNLHHLPL